MDPERIRLYQDLERRIGKTPLIQHDFPLPNGNKIWVKQESENPFGSHYDRVYLGLFKHYEETGKIKPGNKVIETTSGSAGASFAGIGKELGYDCHVVLPAGGETARELAILKYLPDKDHLIHTPEEDYVNGFPRFLRRFLPRNRDYFFLNHSMGWERNKQGQFENNEITLKALENITREAKEEIRLDYFVPAIGNGSSALGPGRVLDGDTKVVGFESFQSATAYDLMHPGEYEERYGIKPGTLSRHRLPGTSYQGINFPHLRNAIQERVLDGVMLVSDKRMDEEYQRSTGRQDSVDLPHWDSVPHEDYGRSTRAGIAVATELAKNEREKNFLVIGYDKANRYD